MSRRFTKVASSTNPRIKRWEEKSLGLLSNDRLGQNVVCIGGSTKKDKLQDDEDKKVKNKRKRKGKTEKDEKEDERSDRMSSLQTT